MHLLNRLSLASVHKRQAFPGRQSPSSDPGAAGLPDLPRRPGNRRRGLSGRPPAGKVVAASAFGCWVNLLDRTAPAASVTARSPTAVRHGLQETTAPTTSSVAGLPASCWLLRLLHRAVAGIREAGGTATARITDVTRPDDVEGLINFAQGELGPINHLVNNAGLMLFSQWANRAADNWNKMIDTNIRGYLHAISAVLPGMIARRSGGYEIARLCAVNGFDLLATGRSGKVDEVAEQFTRAGAHLTPVRADLADLADLAEANGVEMVWRAVEETGRPLAAAVLNAGRSIGGVFLDTDLDDELSLSSLNVTSVVHLAKHVARHMAPHHTGKFLITSSLFRNPAHPLRDRVRALLRLHPHVRPRTARRTQGTRHHHHHAHARRHRQRLPRPRWHGQHRLRHRRKEEQSQGSRPPGLPRHDGRPR